MAPYKANNKHMLFNKCLPNMCLPKPAPIETHWGAYLQYEMPPCTTLHGQPTPSHLAGDPSPKQDYMNKMCCCSNQNQTNTQYIHYPMIGIAF